MLLKSVYSRYWVSKCCSWCSLKQSHAAIFLFHLSWLKDSDFLMLEYLDNKWRFEESLTTVVLTKTPWHVTPISLPKSDGWTPHLGSTSPGRWPFKIGPSNNSAWNRLQHFHLSSSAWTSYSFSFLFQFAEWLPYNVSSAKPSREQSRAESRHTQRACETRR